MAKASIESSNSEHPESPTTPLLARNDDALTVRLRSEGAVGIEELIDLHRAASPSLAVASSSGTRTTTTVFSSRKQSTATKPTSAGTSYPVEDYTEKGKAIVTYASSLSATQGSASEAEADTEITRDNALFGVGDWMADGLVAVQSLKGFARTRKRSNVGRRLKRKKPAVIIQHESIGCSSSDEDVPAIARPEYRLNSRDVKYLRHRSKKSEHNDQSNLAEEGHLSEASTRPLPPKRLSRARSYILISLVVAIVLTFTLSAFAAHHTGKMRMACTKGILFAASVLVSCLTVLAMVVARQALQTALVAGLLGFLVGFSLVVEIDDFM